MEKKNHKADTDVVRISFTIERSLLKSADREAKRLDISRSRLITRGLQELLRKLRERAK